MVKRVPVQMVLQAAACGETVGRIPHCIAKGCALQIHPGKRRGGDHILRTGGRKETVFIHPAAVAAGHAEDLMRCGARGEFRAAFRAAVEHPVQPLRGGLCMERDTRLRLPGIFIVEDAFPDARIERFVGKRRKLFRRGNARYLCFHAPAPAAWPPFGARQVRALCAHGVNGYAQQLAQARRAFLENSGAAGTVDFALRIQQDVSAGCDERAHIPDRSDIRCKLFLAYTLHEAQQVTQRLLVKKVRGNKEIHPLRVERHDGKQKIDVRGMVAKHGNWPAFLADGQRLRPPVSVAQAEIGPERQIDQRIEKSGLRFGLVCLLAFHGRFTCPYNGGSGVKKGRVCAPSV